MKVSATKVVEVPQTLLEQQKEVTGTTPPPPPNPPADLPLLIVVIVPTDSAPDPVPAEAAGAELPHTASQLPLIGILGLLSLTAGLSLRAARLRA